MEAGVTSLEHRQTGARERLEGLLNDVNKTPSQAENEPHQHNYNRTLNPNQDTVITSKTCSGEGEGTDPEAPTVGTAETSGQGHGAGHLRRTN